MLSYITLCHIALCSGIHWDIILYIYTLQHFTLYYIPSQAGGGRSSSNSNWAPLLLFSALTSSPPACAAFGSSTSSSQSTVAEPLPHAHQSERVLNPSFEGGGGHKLKPHAAAVVMSAQLASLSSSQFSSGRVPSSLLSPSPSCC
jgi:hypothetical protein